jgi:hypothetical protein
MIKLKRKIKLTKESKTKKKYQENEDQIWKKIKNQDYGSQDEIENNLKFDKMNKNQNLKSKHWGPDFKYYQTLNWRVKLKTKINSQKNPK